MKTSIIIPSLGRPHILERCLISIYKVLKNHEKKIIEPFETIVINNNDDEKLFKETSKVCGKFKADLNIKEITVPYKLGSVKARNMGINKSSGKFLVFYDDDIVVLKNWFREVFTYLERDDVSGVGGSEIKNEVSKFHKIWFKIREPGRIYPTGEITSNFSPELESIFFVDHLHGSNFATKRQIIDKIGVFDENLVGHYRDETDFTYRLSKVGKMIFNPKAKVIHKPSSVGGSIPPEKRRAWCYWYYRNTAYFFFKHLYSNNKVRLLNFLLRETFFSLFKTFIYRNIFWLLQLPKMKRGYEIWKRAKK